MTRWRPAGAAAGLGVLLALGLASPAGADVAVTIDNPPDGAVATASAVAVSGTATVNGLLGGVDQVAITVRPTDYPTKAVSTTVGGSPFSWTPPPLVYNGPYVVVVSVTGHDLLNAAQSGTATRQFAVEVKPASPANLTVTANPDRTNHVSWSRNTEPDILGYWVQRKAPGSSAFVDLRGVDQPAGGATVAFDDPTAVPPGGGIVAYRVQAIRPGRDGSRATHVESGFSASSVFLAPVAPGTVAPGPTLAPAVPARAPAAAPSLSSFLSRGGTAAPPTASLPAAPALPPDTGFQSTLPFAVPPASPDATDRGASTSAALGDERTAGTTSNRRTLVVPLAAGLFLCVAAFHLRWFGRRLEVTDGYGTADDPLRRSDPEPDGPPLAAGAAALGARKRRRPRPDVAATEAVVAARPERRRRPRPDVAAAGAPVAARPEKRRRPRPDVAAAGAAVAPPGEGLRLESDAGAEVAHRSRPEGRRRRRAVVAPPEAAEAAPVAPVFYDQEQVRDALQLPATGEVANLRHVRRLEPGDDPSPSDDGPWRRQRVTTRRSALDAPDSPPETVAPAAPAPPAPRIRARRAAPPPAPDEVQEGTWDDLVVGAGRHGGR